VENEISQKIEENHHVSSYEELNIERKN